MEINRLGDVTKYTCKHTFIDRARPQTSELYINKCNFMKENVFLYREQQNMVTKKRKQLFFIQKKYLLFEYML